MEAHPIEQHEIDKIVDDGDEEEDFDDEFVSEEELDKLMEEVSNESSILTDIENVSSSSFGTSILTPLDPIHSDPVSVTGMCLALYSESDSGKFFNPSYDFKPIPDQQCDEYMLMRPTEELEGYEKYAAECYKYNIPKISAIKDCLNGNPVLDLSVRKSNTVSNFINYLMNFLFLELQSRWYRNATSIRCTMWPTNNQFNRYRFRELTI